MRHIVAFDISDNKIRRNMVKFLLRRGIRLQESVFVVNIRAKEKQRFIKQLQEIVSDKGIVHIFNICGDCEKKSLAINSKSDYCIIV
jgi:CRISPR-associated endonuclease Cas2